MAQHRSVTVRWAAPAKVDITINPMFNSLTAAIKIKLSYVPSIATLFRYAHYLGNIIIVGSAISYVINNLSFQHFRPSFKIKLFEFEENCTKVTIFITKSIVRDLKPLLVRFICWMSSQLFGTTPFCQDFIFNLLGSQWYFRTKTSSTLFHLMIEFFWLVHFSEQNMLSLRCFPSFLSILNLFHWF